MTTNKFLKNDEAFKNNETMVFKLSTKGSIEKFSLWDNKEQKYLLENTTVTIGDREVEVNKYIKLSDEEKKRYARKVQFVREIIFNGEKRLFGFTKTTEDAINTQIETIESLGNDPLNVTFQLVRTKGAIPLETKYTLSVAKKASLPEPEISFDEEITLEEPLNEKEMAFIAAVKKQYPQFKSRPAPVWVDLMVKKLETTNARATYVVNEHLFK